MSDLHSRFGLVPVIIQSKRKDPKTGKISTFTKRVWVNPYKIKELKQKYKNVTIQNKPEIESSFKPVLSKEEVSARVTPFLSYLHAYAFKMKRKFPMFDVDDLYQQAVLGAIEAIHRNPKLKTTQELKPKITAYAFKSMQNFITENAETMGLAVKYKQKIDKEHQETPERYETVAKIVPLLNEESEDETERMFGRKMLRKVTDIIYEEEPETDDKFPYRVMFYMIAEKFLSPLELEAYKRVKIEGGSLRIVAGELGISYVGVKKAAERAEQKIAKVLTTLAKVKTQPLSNIILNETPAISNMPLYIWSAYRKTFPDLTPAELAKNIQSGKIYDIEESGAIFIFKEKDLCGIVDEINQRYINIGENKK